MKRGLLFYLFSVVCILNTNAQNSAISSHFVFNGKGAADIISMEVRVPVKGVTECTYYEVLGWSGYAGGYAGIQQSPYGRNYIFSIWDNDRQRNPIKAVYTGHGTTTEPFGGEGTGLKSWNFSIPWETDAWYAMNARCWPVGNHTHYGYWIREGVSGEWKHLVTMDVDLDNLSFPTENDAFLEDWSSTGQNRREMHMRHSWRRTKTGQWVASQSGKHQVNYWDYDDETKRSYNYKSNWDAGIESDETGTYYKMITGGTSTVNSVVNGTTFNVPISGLRPDYVPGETSNLVAYYTGFHLNLSWDIVKTKLPQFSYRVKIYENADFSGTPIYSFQTGTPHERVFKTEFKQNPGKYYGQFTMVDLYDHEHVTNFSFDITGKTHDIGLQKLDATNSIGCASQVVGFNMEVANFGSEKLTSFEAKVFVNDVFYDSRVFTASLNKFEAAHFLYEGINVGQKEDCEVRFLVDAPNNQIDPFLNDNEQSQTLPFEGQLLTINNISIVSVTSQYPEEGSDNLFDNDPNSIWHNNWSIDAPLPHEFIFDLGKAYVLTGLDMLNRQNNTNGQPKDVEIYTSLDGINWGPANPVQFESTLDWQSVAFNGWAGARYLKLKITSTISGANACSMAELRFKGCDSYPTAIPVITKAETPTILVYPNPMDETVNVECKTSEPILNIELRDVTGQLKMAKIQGFDLTEASFGMNVSSLSSGIYFLIITTLAGSITSKLIKR